MIDLGGFYSSLAVVALLIATGFFLSKIKILTGPVAKGLTNLILSVILPIAFFRSFPDQFNMADFGLFLWGLGTGLAVLILQIIISQIIFSKKITGKDAYEYKFAFAFNNTSFIGYPLVSATFGQDGLMAYAGFMLPWVLLVFTYGIWLFNKNYTWRDTLKGLINPNVIGIVAGALFFIFSVRLPETLSDTLGLLGGLTTPLSLFCIGFMLSEAKLRRLFKKWGVVMVCILQLTVPAIMTWGLLKLIGAPAVVISVLVLMQALPTAATLGLFTKKYKGSSAADSEAGEIVALSTLLSAVTVPVLVYFLS